MTSVQWREYPSAGAMADAVAADVATIIDSAVKAHGEALVALPGGKSPLPIFACLAAAVIDWKQVTIIPTDDRLVPSSDTLSNFAMIARQFASIGARVLPLAPEETADYRTAGALADVRLDRLPWPPALVWLGVGADGHTASIFPGPDLDAALQSPPAPRALGVLPDPLPPEAPVPRVTLSAAAILSAGRLMLSLAGTEKRRIVERAISEGPYSAFPIGRVLAMADIPVDIHWSPS